MVMVTIFQLWVNLNPSSLGRSAKVQLQIKGMITIVIVQLFRQTAFCPRSGRRLPIRAGLGRLLPITSGLCLLDRCVMEQYILGTLIGQIFDNRLIVSCEMI